MPRIVALSDTHTLHDQVKLPEGDILVHAGDFTNAGEPKDIHRFHEWLYAQPHPHKIVIAGNHDKLFEHNSHLARGILLARDVHDRVRHKSIHYLEDEEATVMGLRFWGSPWTPAFQGWAFNVERGQLWAKWRLIPDGIDVLITHGPPSGDLGGVLPEFKEEVGDPELLERIQQVHPKVHICGHVHSGYGLRERFGIRFVNAAICDEAYEPCHPPVVIDL